jgi:hypothetical protein
MCFGSSQVFGNGLQKHSSGHFINDLESVIMKRRGFLGSIVSIVAASALPKAVEPEPIKPLIRMETLPADSEKARPKFLASGIVGYPQNGSIEFDRVTGRMRLYSEDHQQWFDLER